MKRFSVIARDGLARVGRLETINGENLYLPDACDTEKIFPSLAQQKETNIPPIEDASFIARFPWPSDCEPEMLHPCLSPDTFLAGTVMTPNWHILLQNPRRFLQYLIPQKTQVPPDIAWYLPAAALPSNVAILVCAGYDLFDVTGVDLMSAQGLFCLPEGLYPAKEAFSRELCCCPGCTKEDLLTHNRQALRKELALIRYRIMDGTFPEMLEMRCRTDPTFVSIIRLLAKEPCTEKATPVNRSKPLLATSTDTLRRIEIVRWRDRVIHRYKPPAADVAVFLPCSAKKPYSLSNSHQKFSSSIRQRAHELIVTSPLGLVPREIEIMYPAAHYDVPVTGYWDHEERHLIQDTISQYLTLHPYKRVISHLAGDAHTIVSDAAEAAGLTIERTCSRHPTDPADLACLHETLSGERKVKNASLKGMLSYQFGYVPDTRGLVLKGRYKKQVVLESRRQIFSVDPDTGFLRPTFDGWRILPTGYRVYIDNFLPQGDILAPGITESDPAIRPGDEVFVIGEAAMATGRAVMGGDEMVRSRRGLAVKVRKVKKL